MSEIETPTVATIEALIRNKTPEGLRLDYKSIDVITNSQEDLISKAVSAFANSDGGSLIIGVEKDRANKSLASKLRGDKAAPDKTEWLEQLIERSTSPSVQSYKVTLVLSDTGEKLYWIDVLRSSNAPHQASDNKYYKRNGSHSIPMEHFEIEDVRARAIELEYPLDVRVEIDRGVLADISITNRGNRAINDCRFTFVTSLPLRQETTSRLEKRGLTWLYPKETATFHLGSVLDFLKLESAILEVSFNYFIAGGERRDSHFFDFHDFNFQAIKFDASADQLKKIEKAIVDLGKNVKRIDEHLAIITESFSSSGLQLSDSSLNSLGNKNTPQNRKYDITKSDVEGLRDVLSVTRGQAQEIAHNFAYIGSARGWKDYFKKLPEELQQRILERYEIPD